MAAWPCRWRPACARGGRLIASGQGFRPTYTADPGTLAVSLQSSLAELGVTYVDVLLLHNFSPGMAGLAEVARWFASLKRSGVIRRHGYSIEGDLIEGLSFLASHDLLADAVVQAPVSDTLLGLPREWQGVPIIAHSPFEYLRGQAHITSLANLLSAVGGACRCEALVCSMYDPTHLAANVEAWRSASAR